MQYFNDFGDERQWAWCICCGSGDKYTRDHLPSKVFLDKPYPGNLPIVRVCGRCNLGSSLDEQYVACLIECIKCGHTSPEKIERPKIQRILAELSAVRARAQQFALGHTSITMTSRYLGVTDAGLQKSL